MKGEIVVDGGRYSEDDLLVAIDAGRGRVARRRRVGDRGRRPGGALGDVREALERALWSCGSGEILQRPSNWCFPVDER